MYITGIVSEFNPFHNGHEYLVKRAKEDGDHYVVTVMGGNFLQRGEAAIADKFSRAKAAVEGGVDLVIELPQIYACACAERFARGAVETLCACGCIDRLCFGSESGDITALTNGAKLLVGTDITVYSKKGYSYPRAVRAAADASGDNTLAQLLDLPNDTLAMEYIKAAEGRLSFMAIKRTAPHGDIEPENSDGRYISASMIRKMIISHDEDYKKYVPDYTARIIESEIRRGACPAGFHTNERGVISILRRMTADDLRTLPDVTEGLENRFVKAARECSTLEDIIAAVKCKRYTRARICRIITCAYLGITYEMTALPPQYIRVLAIGRHGTEILKRMKTTASLPAVMSARDFKRLDPAAREVLSVDFRASDLFGMCLPDIGSHTPASDMRSLFIHL